MAIHDQNYVRYDGPLQERGGWVVIAAMTLRLAWSFTRTKLVLLLLWIMPVILAVMVMMEYAVRSQLAQLGGGGPGTGGVLFFLQVELFSLAVLYVASGCGVISDDLRYRTFQLYFSKPLSRFEYCLGKFAGLFVLGSLVTLLPATLLGGLRLAMFARTEHVALVARHTGVGLGLSLALVTLVALVVLGISATTRRTGYAVLAFIGVLLVPLIVQGIVYVVTGGQEFSSLFSIPGNFKLVAEAALGAVDTAATAADIAATDTAATDTAGEAASVPWWAPVLILLGVGAAAAASLWRRVTKLEGVA